MLHHYLSVHYRINDFTLNSIGIKKGLPEDESQALVYLYMAASTLDRDSYLGLLNDFISQYPENQEGYLRRATCYINFGDDSHNGNHNRQPPLLLTFVHLLSALCANFLLSVFYAKICNFRRSCDTFRDGFVRTDQIGKSIPQHFFIDR